MRAKVNSKNESVFFPGGLILVLALIGLIAGGGLHAAIAVGPAAGIVVVSVLALGLGITGAGYPYRLLYDYAPGWDGVRVPGRVFTLATLFYALLAGAGVHGWPACERWHAAAGASRATRASAVGAVAGVVLAIGILGEGAGHLGHPLVPQPAQAEVGLPRTAAGPADRRRADRIWQYYSTDGFYDVPIGNSTFDLPEVDDLRGGMNGFPDRASVEKLRYYHIKTVVLHTVLPKGLPPEHGPVVAEPPDPAAAASKPIAGLGITRRRVGSLVIYTIGPGPAALHGND